MMIINKAVLAMFALLLGSTLAVGEFGDVEFIEDLPEDQVFWGARLLEGSMSVAPTPKPPNPPSGPTPTEKPVETPTEKPVEPPTPSPPSGTVPTEAPPTGEPPFVAPPTPAPIPEPGTPPPAESPTPRPPSATAPTEAPPTGGPPTMTAPTGGQNIVEILSGDARFTQLVDLVIAAGLADDLTGAGPFTVFAPTNEAFNNLGLSSDTPIETIQQVLLYHVLGFELLPLVDGPQTTLNGENVVISDVGAPRPKVNDADIIDEFDATNGVVYPINAVLLPPTDPGTRRYLRA
jgi:uncharacterized surface protein with fasciclin (FAS1) repeats